MTKFGLKLLAGESRQDKIFLNFIICGEKTDCEDDMMSIQKSKEIEQMIGYKKRALQGCCNQN